MMMALGLGGFLAGIFHLLTHAFFKALLFLGSGSIIHAMEHGAHHVHDHHTDPQDMRNMGGLRHKMNATFWAYLAGTAALVGLPPFAGFWSKDEILAEAFQHSDDPLALAVYIAGAVGAAFTAFYMGRQIGLVFGGAPRTELAEHAVEPGKRMTWPLIILAFFAITLGFVNIPADFPVIGHGWLHTFAGEVHHIAEEAAPGIAFEAVPLMSWSPLARRSLAYCSLCWAGGVMLAFVALRKRTRSSKFRSLAPYYLRPGTTNTISMKSTGA
jgi:NADH-quinone oxidoreductase subunit L